MGEQRGGPGRTGRAARSAPRPGHRLARLRSRRRVDPARRPAPRPGRWPAQPRPAVPRRPGSPRSGGPLSTRRTASVSAGPAAVLAASATPNAPATPSAGAPRTARRAIASMTSSTVDSRSHVLPLGQRGLVDDDHRAVHPVDRPHQRRRTTRYGSAAHGCPGPRRRSASHRLPAGARQRGHVPGAGVSRAADALAKMSPEEIAAKAADGSLTKLSGVGDVTARCVVESLAGEEPVYLRRLAATEGSDVARGRAGPAAGPERRLPLPLGLVGRRLADRGDGAGRDRPRPLVPRADRPLTPADRGPRTQRRPAARAARRGRGRQRRRSPTPARTSACSAASRWTFSPTARWTRRPSCSARLDVVVGVCPQWAQGRAGRDDPADAEGHRQPARGHPRPLHGPQVASRGGQGRPGPPGGRGRPESQFDADAVFAACVEHSKAVEINSRPDRLDPPKRLLRQAYEAGCVFTIDTDAHAPGQLDWLRQRLRRAALCGVEPSAWSTPGRVRAAARLGRRPTRRVHQEVLARAGGRLAGHGGGGGMAGPAGPAASGGCPGRRRRRAGR